MGMMVGRGPRSREGRPQMFADEGFRCSSCYIVCRVCSNVVCDLLLH